MYIVCILEDCCPKITLSSQGGVQEHYSEALGDYVIESYDNDDKPIYRHKTNLISIYLHHTKDSEHNWSGWQFTRDISDVFGYISNENDDICPSGTVFFQMLFRLRLRQHSPWVLIIISVSCF